jgi:hypothetical protein
MVQFEISTRVVNEQHRDWLADVERQRMIAACEPEMPLARRVARPIGRVLMRMGAMLLRYGRDESPADIQLYRASGHSIQWN